MLTERQRDQALAERMRDENLRRANLGPRERQAERLEDFCGLNPRALGIRADGTVPPINRGPFTYWRNGAGLPNFLGL